MHNYDFRLEIGREIAEIRKRLDLTLDGFAALFNRTDPRGDNLTTTGQNIWKYENGASPVSAEKYKKFLSLGGK